MARTVENVEKLEPVNSKERLETWKFAAEEIVDLLKTVRQEGEGGKCNSHRLLLLLGYVGYHTGHLACGI